MKVFAFVSEGQEEEKNMLENIQSIIEHAGSTGNLLMTHGFEPVTEAFGIRFYPARRKVIMDEMCIRDRVHYMKKKFFFGSGIYTAIGTT